MSHKLFSKYGYYIGPKIPQECIDECTHAGECYEEVKYWQKELQFEAPKELAIDYLKAYGAWTLEDLNAQTELELNLKVLWLACLEIKESGEWIGLVH